MTGAQYQQLIEGLRQIKHQLAVANKIQLFKIRLNPPPNNTTGYGPDDRYHLGILEDMTNGTV